MVTMKWTGFLEHILDVLCYGKPEGVGAMRPGTETSETMNQRHCFLLLWPWVLVTVMETQSWNIDHLIYGFEIHIFMSSKILCKIVFIFIFTGFASKKCKMGCSRFLVDACLVCIKLRLDKLCMSIVSALRSGRQKNQKLILHSTVCLKPAWDKWHLVS